MPHVLRHLSRPERRTTIRCALANAGLWGAGSGLVSLTLVTYLAHEYQASPRVFAWIMATPSLAGLLRLFAPWWVRRVGGRKRFSIALFTASAVTVLALPVVSAPHVLPLPGESLAALVALWFVFHALDYVAAVALWSWLGDMTPLAIRGRFFGRRESWLNIGKAIGTLVAAFGSWFWNDRCARLDRPYDEWMSYAACAIAGAACYLLAVVPLVRMHDRPDADGGTQALPLRSLLSPFMSPKYRRLLMFGVWFSLANGLFSSVRRVYELQGIRLSLFEKKMLDAGSRGVQSQLSPLAGRVVDRRGNVAVLAATQAVIGLAPLFYVLASPGAVWWILGAYACWLAYAGENVAQPNLMIGLSPRVGRASFIAVWFATNQVAVSAGIFLGAEVLQWVLSGAVAETRAVLVAGAGPTVALPGGAWSAPALLAAVGGAKYRVGNFTGLLIGAAVLQVAGAWWALRIPEPQENHNDSPAESSRKKSKSG
ncbi:MAG: MFS transporter [Planctomycetales bacterium]|nr:MFS transporter [Planctomycetales bacterium]